MISGVGFHVPQLTSTEARELLQREFAITAAVAAMPSERDQNFHVTSSDGHEYLLKIAAAADDASIIAFQNTAMRAAGRADRLSAQSIVPTRTGKEFHVLRAGTAQHIVRVLTFLPGVPASGAAPSPALRRATGSALGRLDRSLAEIDKVDPRGAFLWDLARAGDVRKLLGHITENSDRTEVQDALDAFGQEVAPVLPVLRTQVIHGDFHPTNYLVSSDSTTDIVGVLDFGDSTRSQLVNDVAIAITNQITGADDAVSAACDVLAGFHEEFPLRRSEVDVLWGLLRARLAMRLVIAASRAGSAGSSVWSTDTTLSESVTALRNLRAVGREAACAAFRAACELPARGFTGV